MIIRIKRTPKTAYTHGSLTIEGHDFKCFTLEDAERSVKIKGETAIAKGKYEVILNMSNRFKTYMPLLLNVPNFEGVRIHSGNTKEHTEGCILVGFESGDDGFLGNSKDAFRQLMAVLKKVEKKEKIFLIIE